MEYVTYYTVRTHAYQCSWNIYNCSSQLKTCYPGNVGILAKYHDTNNYNNNP